MNTSHYKQQFDVLKNNFSGQIVSKHKLDSFDRFCELGWPTTREEAWRYSKINKLVDEDFINYSLNLERPSSLVNANFDFPVSHLVFRNGVFDKQLSQLSREAMSYIKFKDKENFLPLPEKSKFHNSALLNLNMSFNLQTFSLDIPENTIVSEPIVFHFLYEDGSSNMYHPQIEVSVGHHSQVKFIELHSSQQSGKNLINPLSRVRLAESSKVKYVRLSEMTDPYNFHNGQFIGQLEKSSDLHFVSMNLGGGLNRLDTEFFHQGEGAYLEVNGLCYGKNKEQVSYLSRIFHEKGNGESHQLYKGVLDDQSSSSFDGLIYIAPKAQKVNSSQMNKNLLLSSRAEVNTKPQLDINADDVKAAHGATVSELNDEEIFYLMSRGIEKNQATKIIEKAFIDEIILKVGDLNIQKWLLKFFENERSS